MIRRPPRSTLDRSSAASDVYKRQKSVSKEVEGRNEIAQVGSISANNDKAIGNLIADACLLYTSPSPRDRTRSRMPSSA